MIRALSIIILCILFFSIHAQEQNHATIRGKVLDARTGNPVELTNVYLSGTTRGSSTDQNGNFRIDKIPYGNYELVALHIAYQLSVQPVQVKMEDQLYFTIDLEPKVYEGTAVEVKGEDPEEWRRLFKKFKKAFIGTSPNSFDCQLLNPEVIELKIDDQSGNLIAWSDSIIILANNALGYTIRLFINDFNWEMYRDSGKFMVYPIFVEMDTANSDKINEYKRRRLQTYKGSCRHFLATVANNNLDNEEFFIGRSQNPGHSPKPIRKSTELEVLPVQDLSGFFEMSFYNYMIVYYQNHKSWIKLKTDRLIFDSYGNTSDYGLIKYGDWAKERMADVLPSDYIPEENY